MPVGFNGAVSLISGTHLSLANIMGLTVSNSGLFRAPFFIVSPVGKGERRRKKKGEGKEGKRNRKGMEGRKKE